MIGRRGRRAGSSGIEKNLRGLSGREVRSASFVVRAPLGKRRRPNACLGLFLTAARQAPIAESR